MRLDLIAEATRSRVDRRRFLLGAGAVSAAGVAAAACGRAGDVSTAARASADGQASGQGGAATAVPTAARPTANGELHDVYPAALPPASSETRKQIALEAIEKPLEVAAGVLHNAWSFGGTVPGPILHLRQGDTVDFTLTNKGSMGHSIDFHAAQTPWDLNYKTILPNDSLSFTWTANYPGVFMYHCGTGPVIEHLINGMYGAVIVSPADPLPPAREYVLVQSEFYLKPAANGNWDGDSARALAVQPDFVVFNGAANQYRDHPLAADPGELVRLWVVNAGPSLFSAFHVIGAIFDRVCPDGNPANVLRGVQTQTVPPGGGAMFELTVPERGLYPFVTHAFAYTGLGALGVLDVGGVGGGTGVSH